MKHTVILIALAMLHLTFRGSAASHVTLSLQNATSTNNRIEFDVYIVNDGTTNLALGGYQFGINFSNTILNGGTPAAGSFILISGTRDPIFSPLSTPSSAYNNSQLKSVATTLSPGVPLAPTTQYCLGRYRFTNTVNWTSGSVPNFSFQLAPQTGKTMAIAQCFVNGAAISTSLRHDSSTLNAVSFISSLTLNVPLPVSLLQFNGKQSGPQDLLNWETAEELNNHYFNVQHSTDGLTFKTIGRVESKAEKGISRENLAYSFIHTTPVSGHNYYRLEQIDIDGQATISGKVIDLERAPGYLMELYPNPANDQLTLRFDLLQASNCRLQLFDLSGRLLRTIDWLGAAGTNTVHPDLSGLSSATYLLHLTCNGNLVCQRKFQKQ